MNVNFNQVENLIMTIFLSSGVHLVLSRSLLDCRILREFTYPGWKGLVLPEKLRQHLNGVTTWNPCGYDLRESHCLASGACVIISAILATGGFWSWLLSSSTGCRVLRFRLRCPDTPREEEVVGRGSTAGSSSSSATPSMEVLR